jgi:hypothetical protein
MTKTEAVIQILGSGYIGYVHRQDEYQGIMHELNQINGEIESIK